jgi:hypothetical protein
LWSFWLECMTLIIFFFVKLLSFTLRWISRIIWIDNFFITNLIDNSHDCISRYYLFNFSTDNFFPIITNLIHIINKKVVITRRHSIKNTTARHGKDHPCHRMSNLLICLFVVRQTWHQSWVLVITKI